MVIHRKSMRIALISFILGVVVGVGGYLVFFQGHRSSVIEHDVFPVIDSDSENTIPDEFAGKLSLFILAGQSNMSGRGEMPTQSQKINPRVFVFGNDYRWHYAIEPIDNHAGQVDLVSRDGKARYSLATAFANTLLEKDSSLIIGFIPCARGATSIEKWQRNLSENSLYGSCLKRGRAASTMGQIVGLLFYQGEADALDPEVYPQRKPSPFEWAKKFSRFVRDMRSELGIPDLPIIYAQLNQHTAPDRYVYWEQVRKQQAQVNLPNTRMVGIPNLGLSDYVHFTREGYDILGKLFAEAHWGLTHQ